MATRQSLLTVREVAGLRRVSERTVWNDIKAGKLPVVRRAGRTYVRRSCLTEYRALPGSSAPLLTPKELGDQLGVTLRSVRRALAAQKFPSIRLGGRRFIQTDRGCKGLGGFSIQEYFAMGGPVRSRRANLEPGRECPPPADSVVDQALTILKTKFLHTETSTGVEHRIVFYPYERLTLRELEKLTGVPTETLRSHVRKGALRARRIFRGARELGVLWPDAYRYVESEAARDAVLDVAVWNSRPANEHVCSSGN